MDRAWSRSIRRGAGQSSRLLSNVARSPRVDALRGSADSVMTPPPPARRFGEWQHSYSCLRQCAPTSVFVDGDYSALAAVLASPHFFYPSSRSARRNRATQRYELASRLSYFPVVVPADDCSASPQR